MINKLKEQALDKWFKLGANKLISAVMIVFLGIGLVELFATLLHIEL